MRSATTHENQGSNSRGCHTEYNGSLGPKSIAKCIVDIGLASSTRAMKKETAKGNPKRTL
jgi:hypothetical protein